jgi:Tol biopolymer transport system component
MNPAITRLLFPAMLLIMAATSCSDGAMECFNRGKVEKVHGDLNSAERDFQRAARLDPGNADAHYNLGAVILQKGRVDEAMACFRKALAIDPGQAGARKELDKALRSKEETVSEAAIPTGKLAFVTSANFGSPGSISVMAGHRLTATPAYDTRALEFLPDGIRLIYYANDFDVHGIYLYDLTQDTDIPLVTNAENGMEPSWSPDGSRIAFVKYSEGPKSCQIYTANIDGTESRQLTRGPYYNWTPRWSPDGRKLVLETTRNSNLEPDVNSGGYRDIYVMDANGQNQINLTKKTYGHHPSWSPDGKSIAYMSYGESGAANIYVMKSDGSFKQNISHGVTRDSEPVWSPDGQWIAFTRTANKPGDSEAMDIWIMKSDGTEQRQVTFNQSNFTSYSPSWAR